jgi:hypothetical protein
MTGNPEFAAEGLGSPLWVRMSWKEVCAAAKGLTRRCNIAKMLIVRMTLKDNPE